MIREWRIFNFKNKKKLSKQNYTDHLMKYLPVSPLPKLKFQKIKVVEFPIIYL